MLQNEGVFVKLPKTNQDRRIDMPTLGLTTIENASLAGLAGIAFAGEETQLIDADACIKRGRAWHIFKRFKTLMGPTHNYWGKHPVIFGCQINCFKTSSSRHCIIWGRWN